MHTRYFEDFSAGDSFTTRGITLSEGLILEFALMYDPQHMHTDKVRAEAGPFGGLIASGFQTLALSFRQFYDLGLVVQSNIIGPGMDEVRWKAPVFPGDTIHSVWDVLETRTSNSKPDRGIVRWRCRTFNQDEVEVMSYESVTMVKRRDA